jgi:hypothetical protein
MSSAARFDAPGVLMAVGAETLEVRWILRGRMPPEAAQWFRPAPGVEGIAGGSPTSPSLGWTDCPSMYARIERSK